jgi:hypothetical protein
MRAFRLQREILQTLQDTLSKISSENCFLFHPESACPCCLESIGKGEVISLACGHTLSVPRCCVCHQAHSTSLLPAASHASSSGIAPR